MKHAPPKLTPAQQRQFLDMLPLIRQVARQAFAPFDPEAREELTAEVIAVALLMFVGLVRQGRETSAYATPLARYGVARVRDGRRANATLNVNDVTSAYCQRRRAARVGSLDRHARDGNDWRDLVIEDRRAGPAEVVQVRLDFASWLQRLPHRKRRIAETLAVGESTGTAARRFHVSPARISQLRREFAESWSEFQGPEPLLARRTSPSPITRNPPNQSSGDP
jgi:hypothetical protein